MRYGRRGRPPGSAEVDERIRLPGAHGVIWLPLPHRLTKGFQMDRDDVVVGEHYAYRARSVDPLVEVRVMKVGTQKPARVHVSWVDEAFEGKQEWVPPARLKVGWGSVETFLAEETKWAAVRELSPGSNSIEDSVAWEVFESFIDAEIAECGYNADSGVITIHDVRQLSSLLDIPEDELRSDPRSFEIGSSLVASWLITELVARRAAMKFADQLLAKMSSDERQAQREAIPALTCVVVGEMRTTTYRRRSAGRSMTSSAHRDGR